jgi:DNA invertase Pin-like site-specific DNA recombinase
MRVSIYTRVSTDDKEQNPERQIKPCKSYCDTNQHEVIGTFSEFITGDSNPYTRPVFSDMMKLQPQGVVVYSIDRLTRQHPNKTMLLLSQFKNAGIIIISVSEPIFNMESIFAEPMQYFITWWNNYFLRKLKDDIKTGLERAKAQGKVLGRPKVRFNEYRAYQLLVVEKKSITEAHIQLGVSRATLFRFKKVAEKNPKLFINNDYIS